MCADAGVKGIYLPPYSPDFNPIEELFAEFKAFIKHNWSYYEVSLDQGLDAFLGWCIDVVGAKEESAGCHFRRVSLKIEEVPENYQVHSRSMKCLLSFFYHSIQRLRTLPKRYTVFFKFMYPKVSI